MAEELREREQSRQSAGSGPPRRAWYRDWRVWLGIGISIACVGFLFRGVPLDEVSEAMGRADLLLLFGLSVPAYVLNVWVRALRWRHLTNPITEISRGTMYRAEALGFTVNNLVPLRVGELVRCWYLAREVRAPVAAILGTVVLERVLDIVSVLVIAIAALSLVGAGSAEGGLLEEGSRLLLPVALLPVMALIALRVMPETLYRLAGFLCRPLPQHLGEWVVSSLRTFADGLGALSGGSHLFWIVFHSATAWLVASTLPILAAIWAFDIDLGGPVQTLTAAWILLGATGVAVAIPSAPGFFGPYQLACKAVLVRFGVDPATALAVGMLMWVVFWLSLTSQGLVMLRGRRPSLAELTADPGKDPAADRR